ncbi:glycosyltransferase [Shewanella dokdonensis]|uniref:Glycosyltransferase n=1 Tax=Shewanella dokdonensis TaxID=712036 RepID=A0ABX8DIK6_9GAMM|nr:glycosyltransferase [Shewanella dokdonensis]MCL1075572.1 glycosyltransferase [Shewanella dokdonensis]QVK24587.1 glycosyltransferase [Shewanella dokdonensis]
MQQNSNKRIAIVIDSLAGGGAEKVMLTLAKGLLAQGHQPHIIVLQPAVEHEVPVEIPLHFCFDAHERNLDSFWRLGTSVARLRQYLETLQQHVGRFDLFLSNLHQTNLLMTRTGVAPLYCVVHNSLDEELKRQRKLGPLAWLDMRRAQQALNGQHLVAVSEGVADELRHSRRIKPASVTTIYNPFSLAEIRQQADVSVADLPAGDYIIHVGRFARQKRHDVLFAALKKMRHDIPLVLLCSNRRKALKAIRKMGLEQRVIVPGFQQNPFPWIKHARLLVLSSDYEGFGNVLLEAIALGTPAVSTCCPHGPSEILSGPLSKWLVPRRDPAALAAVIDQALDESPDVLSAAILNQVALDTIVERYLSLLAKD